MEVTMKLSEEDKRELATRIAREFFELMSKKDEDYMFKEAFCMMNQKQVAEYLHVNRSTVSRWIVEGKFPQGKEVCGVRRWDLATVRKYVR